MGKGDKMVIDDEIDRIVELHTLWLASAPGGIKADFSGRYMFGIDLPGKDLRHAVFTRVSMQRADLSGCDLRGADFSDADLLKANLSGADVRGAIFRRANLFCADFENTHGVNDADFTGASLFGTDL